MASYPRDQFDDLPVGVARIGAHRAAGKRGTGWIAFASAVVATVALIAAGLFIISRFDHSFEVPLLPAEPIATETETPEPVVTAEPITDPASLPPEQLSALVLSVLNGTETNGLASVAATQLVEAGWPDPSRAAASSTTEELTIVYYATAADEGVARGIAQLIGTSEVRLSDAFPGTSVTVVLGADYVAPAEADAEE